MLSVACVSVLFASRPPRVPVPLLKHTRGVTPPPKSRVVNNGVALIPRRTRRVCVFFCGPQIDPFLLCVCVRFAIGRIIGRTQQIFVVCGELRSGTESLEAVRIWYLPRALRKVYVKANTRCVRACMCVHVCVFVVWLCAAYLANSDIANIKQQARMRMRFCFVLTHAIVARAARSRNTHSTHILHCCFFLHTLTHRHLWRQSRTTTNETFRDYAIAHTSYTTYIGQCVCVCVRVSHIISVRWLVLRLTSLKLCEVI